MPAIQGLWIGTIGRMQKLCILSFLHHGHDFHLYGYVDPHLNDYFETRNTGTGEYFFHPATKILPEAEVLPNPGGTGKPTYALFSDYFRYVMLHKRGGIWVDLDTVCLRPWFPLFEKEYIFAMEILENGRYGKLNASPMACPPRSEIMLYCVQETDRIIREVHAGLPYVWGSASPLLITEAVKKFGLDSYVKSEEVFSPLCYTNWQDVLNPEKRFNLEKSYSIHLYNEMWRRADRDPNAEYSPDCQYEKWCREYGV
jgi:hypothetical protein